MVAEVDEQTIREHVIKSLCWVRDAKRPQVDAEVKAHGGDMRIDSKEGEAICVLVEDALGLGEIVQASDLRPEELTSISSLTRLFVRRTNDRMATAGKAAA